MELRDRERIYARGGMLCNTLEGGKRRRRRRSPLFTCCVPQHDELTKKRKRTCSSSSSFYSGKNETGMLRFPSGRQPRKRGTRNRVLCGPISPLTSSPPSFSFIIFLLKVHFKSSENCFSLGDNSAHTHKQRDTL